MFAAAPPPARALRASEAFHDLRAAPGADRLVLVDEDDLARVLKRRRER